MFVFGTESDDAALSSVAVMDDSDDETEDVEAEGWVEEREMVGGRIRERTVCAGSK